MRQPKPYFKASHKAWYVNLRGKPHRLAEEEKAAWQEYHRLMAGEAPVTSKTTVVALLDRFLVWTKDNRKPKTYSWYFDHLQSFTKYIGGKLKVGDLKPFHVTQWLDKARKKSGGWHRRGSCKALKRAFTWACQQGLISDNPLKGLEMPAGEPREVYLEPADWARVLAIIEGKPLGDFFCFMRETGCRPEEARLAEACHWDRKHEQIVLPLALTKGKKGKKMPRIIRLNQAATAIVERLALKNPKGPLFRNRDGRAWTSYALNCRCRTLRKKLGLKHFLPYIFRHTWCTDALLRGVDPITVAILMGHKDGAMVMKVYNHLVRQNEFLKEKLRQATGEITTTNIAEAGS